MSVVIQQQPRAVPNEMKWTTGLCECCTDMRSCCCAFWCFPCFTCDTASEFGVCLCIPIMDLCAPAILTAFGLGTAIGLGTATGFRAATHLGIVAGANYQAVNCLAAGLCVPPVALSMRVAVRYKYQIRGGLCDDILISLCCLSCSWCQMNREIRYQKQAPAVIYAQPEPIHPSSPSAPPLPPLPPYSKY